MSLLLYFIVVGGIMYFLMIRPQKKRQEKHKDMLSSMGVGDHAVTIGGLHGVIYEIDEVKNTITLDCEGVLLVFERSAIARTQRRIQRGLKRLMQLFLMLLRLKLLKKQKKKQSKLRKPTKLKKRMDLKCAKVKRILKTRNRETCH